MFYILYRYLFQVHWMVWYNSFLYTLGIEPNKPQSVALFTRTRSMCRIFFCWVWAHLTPFLDKRSNLPYLPVPCWMFLANPRLIMISFFRSCSCLSCSCLCDPPLGALTTSSTPLFRTRRSSWMAASTG